MDPKLIRDPAKVKKAQTRQEALLVLYPRDLVREMVKLCMDAELLPFEDLVILPNTSAEQLEAELAKDFKNLEGVSPDELAEFEKMNDSLRKVRGKKISELPGQSLTEELFVAEIEEETETVIASVLNAWMQTLSIYRKQNHNPPLDLLLTDTLEPAVPIRFGKTPEITWQEAPCNSIMLTPEQVGKLHEAFAAKLRPLIDAAGPDGYVLWNEEFVIKKDVTQNRYCLRPSPTECSLANF